MFTNFKSRLNTGLPDYGDTGYSDNIIAMVTLYLCLKKYRLIVLNIVGYRDTLLIVTLLAVFPKVSL